MRRWSHTAPSNVASPRTMRASSSHPNPISFHVCSSIAAAPPCFHPGAGTTSAPSGCGTAPPPASPGGADTCVTVDRTFHIPVPPVVTPAYAPGWSGAATGALSSTGTPAPSPVTDPCVCDTLHVPGHMTL